MTKKFTSHRRKLAWLLGFTLLTACAETKIVPSTPQTFTGGEAIATRNAQYMPLSSFEKRKHKINIAVYDFPDLTGANASNDKFADFSKAVTQGADALVMGALTDVGQGTWFRVLERRFNDAVLNERRIVQSQEIERKQRVHTAQERARISLAQDNVNAEYQHNLAILERDYREFSKAGRLPQGYPDRETALANLAKHRDGELRKIEPEKSFSAASGPAPVGALTTAKYLVTGAIVAYDTNTDSGGTGLRIANIGYRQERRKDIITVNLRIVDVGTGEVLANETVTQTVFSIRKQGDTLNYVTLNTVLEFESGLVINEPATFALDAAIRVALSDALQEL